jgi:Polyketide cyclase / dehydrase and lipid transport
MNWFWIAIAVLAGLGILILGIGALLPREHRAACTIRLRAAPHDVWSAITDWRALPSWRTELSSVEELPGGGGWVETSKWGRMSIAASRSRCW